MTEKSELREILFALDQARRKFLQPRFTELGLTLGQGQPRILNSLLKRESVTQKELADTCRLEATTLSRTLDHMEKSGLIVRRKDPECRRSFRILLTDKGRETARQVRQALTQLDDILWQGFTPQEMDALWEGLKKIECNLKNQRAL
ncbi:MAG: MarR family transcriptional regulator [Clostridiales bacterium]|jgi:DNA-binding MarR family transcriptional regulator|nr:MarR family transcriptional regulator [Clostridiales bacterium]